MSDINDSLGKEENKDLIKTMIMSNGGEGSFVLDAPEKEETKEDFKISPGKIKERLGKYSEEYIKQAMRDPEKFFIKTPKGKMSLKDAILLGWDPKKKEFNEDRALKKKLEKSEEKLSPKEKETLARLKEVNKISEADAEEMGVDPNKEMVQKGESLPTEEAPQKGVSPDILKKLLGGKR